MPHSKKAPNKDIIKLYKEGFSCQDIAKIFSMSRQAVWERLKTNGVKLRTKKILPFIIYDEIKFTASDNGYYRATRRDKNISLHRYKYTKEVEPIPKGYEIHHINGDKQDNSISNLECLSKSDHTKKYSPHHNQYKNNRTIKEGKYESD